MRRQVDEVGPVALTEKTLAVVWHSITAPVDLNELGQLRLG